MLAMSLEVCDISPADDVNAFLSCATNSACSVVLNRSSSGSPGCVGFSATTAIGVEGDNTGHSYFLQVCNDSSSNLTKFRTVKLFYELQLSPAPATATFADVPTTHLYFRAIEALAKSGESEVPLNRERPPASGRRGGSWAPERIAFP